LPSRPPPELSLQEWVTKSENSPFVVPPPAPVGQAVHVSLEQVNACQAQEHVKARMQAGLAQNSSAVPLERMEGSKNAEESVEAKEWGFGPSQEWMQTPIASRAHIGRTLVDSAILFHRQARGTGQSSSFKMDTWSTPFTVGYLNVGRRHLVGSLQEVVEIVLRQRPDILFLGDLVTTRDQIGRLKKRLESDLGDEWFLSTNISELPGRPVGVGALIHCSLANYMTDCILPQFDESNGARAVAGRILSFKVTRPEFPYVWQIVGIYQHVAKPSNRKARALLHETLQALTSQARQKDHRLVLLGDFNAAPPMGRWGYARWSATAKEDCIMAAWIQESQLIEVSQRGKRTATWRPSEGHQRAILDRVFISADHLCSMDLSVHWHHPMIVFDHALLILRIQNSLAGTGYAGACRPLSETNPPARCPIDLKKWKSRLDVWQHLLSSGLQYMESEHAENPPDPFESLKQGELLAMSCAYALAPK